jgi:hypothetical protein
LSSSLAEHQTMGVVLDPLARLGGGKSGGCLRLHPSHAELGQDITQHYPPIRFLVRLKSDIGDESASQAIDRQTGINVQHVFDDEPSETGHDRLYVGVRCLACSGIHLVSRTTGRLVGNKGDE